MGPRLRLRDLRGCAGVGAEAADRARPLRQRSRGDREGDRTRRGFELMLLRRDRNRQEPVREGRLLGDRAGVPVRLDQPRLGARPRAVGADRMAVHARRVPRGHRDDRRDVADVAAVRLAAPGRSAREHAEAAAVGHQHQAAGTEGCGGGRASEPRRVVGRRAQLPRRLADALQGDNVAFCSPVSSGCSATASSTGSSSAKRPGLCERSRTSSSARSLRC